MKNVVSFSGGKDSTEMLFGLIDRGIKIDEIVFGDTMLEFPEMYAYIKRVSEHLLSNITILCRDESGG